MTVPQRTVENIAPSLPTVDEVQQTVTEVGTTIQDVTSDVTAPVEDVTGAAGIGLGG